MKKYYLGTRRNPQLPKPYYVAYGQLTKKDAKSRENCLYGSMYLRPFDTKEEYENEILLKESMGYRVSKY
jgi:hypothetical protein